MSNMPKAELVSDKAKRELESLHFWRLPFTASHLGQEGRCRLGSLLYSGGEKRTQPTIIQTICTINLLRILYLSSLSAKESFTSSKGSSERKEKKQEKTHRFPKKDSESFEKQAAKQSCKNSARGL